MKNLLRVLGAILLLALFVTLFTPWIVAKVSRA
jgi:hypothetical protein